MYKIRIPIGLALLSCIGGLVYCDYYTNTSWCTSLILGLLILASFFEFCTMFQEWKPFRCLGTILVSCNVLCLILHAAYAQTATIPTENASSFSFLWSSSFLQMLEMTSIILIFVMALYKNQDQKIIESMSITIFGFMGVYMLLSFLLRIRSFGSKGLFFLLLLVLVAKGMDMGGYLIGKAFGKHKIAPNISPKKSWEGFFGGLIFSGLFAFFLPKWLPELTPFSIYQWFFFALITGLLSFMGDLAESFLKRKCGKKDSGNILPEFGGFFDITDSLLFVAPWGYFFYQYCLV
ncbi:MAG: phosphatidate cytidylyltransferase [Planctomycetes bacterium]|nr:phosphatidate cytidylyltransferase [Planctomycetota bacterium]HNZ67340.1 phosphatidate cytidylyltransferase [Planctomycetota bacterium]HPY74017.1 phosphatidate cytidylyltransferase [Planctomycetota bacterium]HQB01182.1 phosphatidate cytidylyltransferase [Planctomycetota bacterium]